MSTYLYTNGVLRERWEDSTRTYTAWNSSGVQTSTRPYTTQENSEADLYIANMLQESNRATIETSLFEALALLQAIVDDTNTNINGNPAQRIKDLARTLRRVIRLSTRRFDSST